MMVLFSEKLVVMVKFDDGEIEYVERLGQVKDLE
jgi:hypothetical protein